MVHSHLTDKKLKGSADFAQWEQVDAEILSLMVSSIQPIIGSSLMYLDIAEELTLKMAWLCKSYSVYKEKDKISFHMHKG